MKVVIPKIAPFLVSIISFNFQSIPVLRVNYQNNLTFQRQFNLQLISSISVNNLCHQYKLCFNNIRFRINFVFLFPFGVLIESLFSISKAISSHGTKFIFSITMKVLQNVF